MQDTLYYWTRSLTCWVRHAHTHTHTYTLARTHTHTQAHTQALTAEVQHAALPPDCLLVYLSAATLREEGFLVSKRRFSSTIKTGQKVCEHNAHVEDCRESTDTRAHRCLSTCRKQEMVVRSSCLRVCMALFCVCVCLMPRCVCVCVFQSAMCVCVCVCVCAGVCVCVCVCVCVSVCVCAT